MMIYCAKNLGRSDSIHRRPQPDINGLPFRDQDNDGGPSPEGSRRLHRLLLDMHELDVHSVRAVSFLQNASVSTAYKIMSLRYRLNNCSRKTYMICMYLHLKKLIQTA